MLHVHSVVSRLPLVLGLSVTVVLTATNVLDNIEETIVLCAVEECSDGKGLAFTLVGAAVDDNPLDVV